MYSGENFKSCSFCNCKILQHLNFFRLRGKRSFVPTFGTVFGLLTDLKIVTLTELQLLSNNISNISYLLFWV